jgi:hypothetical protein
MTANHFRRPIKILPVANDKLHLVGGFQVIDIGPKILFRHPTGRTFEIDNPFHTRINLTDVEAASRFEKCLVSSIAESSHELVHTVLKERFAAGDFDKPALIVIDAIQNLSYRHRLTFIEGIFCVAIAATKIAVGEPNKDTWHPHATGFALNAVKDLVDD